MFYDQDLHEHVTQLDIYNRTPAVVYSVLVKRFEKNQVLQVTTELEATNNYHYNVMISCKVILGNDISSTKGTLIDQSNGFNITPNMHHGVITKSRSWKSQSTYDNKYVNVVCMAISDNAAMNNFLKIENAYGHLDVFIVD